MLSCKKRDSAAGRRADGLYPVRNRKQGLCDAAGSGGQSALCQRRSDFVQLSEVSSAVGILAALNTHVY